MTKYSLHMIKNRLKYGLVTSLLIFPLLALSQSNIETRKEIKNDSVYIDFINPFYAPVTFTFKENDSLKGVFITAPKIILKAKDTAQHVVIIPLSLINDTTSINLNHYAKIKGTLGKPDIKPNYKYAYALPYPKGKSYKIMQSFGGKFSHTMEHSKYAIDFAIPVGDTITAAREGVVVLTIDHFKEHGGRDFINKANKIVIMHDDGTFAHYNHLDYQGVLVQNGDYVEKGKPIGISGFTGFSTKPHLHFVVLEEDSKSIPIYFEGLEKKVLKKGKSYKNH